MDKGYNLFNKWLIEHYKQGFCDAFVLCRTVKMSSEHTNF